MSILIRIFTTSLGAAIGLFVGFVGMLYLTGGIVGAIKGNDVNQIGQIGGMIGGNIGIILGGLLGLKIGKKLSTKPQRRGAKNHITKL